MTVVGKATVTLAVALACAMARPASADKSLYDRLWRMPTGSNLTWSHQVEEQLGEIGNLIGHHLDVLSYDLLTLHFDAHQRRAYVRFGGGDERFLSLHLASDVHFVAGLARVNTRIDLAFHGRMLRVELPEMEMLPASVNGERGVELRMPLFRRTF